MINALIISNITPTCITCFSGEETVDFFVTRLRSLRLIASQILVLHLSCDAPLYACDLLVNRQENLKDASLTEVTLDFDVTL